MQLQYVITAGEGTLIDHGVAKWDSDYDGTDLYFYSAGGSRGGRSWEWDDFFSECTLTEGQTIMFGYVDA